MTGLAATGLGTQGVTKRFGATTALSDVSFEVAPGDVVALLGENGAGKTTLLRVVSGFLEPDAGSVVLDAGPIRLGGPRDAAARGIGMVHQHFLLIPELTVAENVVLGREPRRGPFLDRDAAEQEVAACADRFGLRVDPRARVADLGVADRQRVELVKVLVRGARYLLLDEPTGLLPPAGVRDLFALVERLAGEGCGVVLVTHRLREVFAVCSRAYVLRGGAVTGERAVADATQSELAGLMVGSDTDLVTAAGRRLRPPASKPTEREEEDEDPDPVLQVSELTVLRPGGPPLVDRVSVRVFPGEIVGLAGVSGSGQVELLRGIAGVADAEIGGLRLGGRDLRTETVRGRRELGLGFVPEDRLHGGVVPDLTVSENLQLGAGPDRVEALGASPEGRAAREEAGRLVEEHDIRPADPDALCGALSGGNQQKVLLARELTERPRVLLAAEPARGLDFRAAEAVHARLREVAANGGGVLVASTDLEELLSLCDRIVVMFAGEVAGEVRPETTTEEEIGLLMSGAASAGGAS